MRTGKHDNTTKAGILFDKHGAETKEKIIYCSDWKSGFVEAKSLGYHEALFVDSGTVITDWVGFINVLENYPSREFIAHLIWQPGKNLELDQQCWFMYLDNFEIADFDAVDISHPCPVRSQQNLHDDYTPLWVKPGADLISYQTTGFGQGLIARQLNRGRALLNWNNHARGIKFFCYPSMAWKDHRREWFGDYLALAESQLWVLNNEKIQIVDAGKILSPGSGLFWIVNLVSDTLTDLQIVDISQTQVKFCQALRNTWDGTDYGSFAWHFIQRHGLTHFEIEQANLSDLDRLRLRSKDRFIKHVNYQFYSTLQDLGINDFQQRWKRSCQTKSIDIQQGNLIDWVLENKIRSFDYVWKSNIDRYKWTMLHNTSSEIQRFLEIAS